MKNNRKARGIRALVIMMAMMLVIGGTGTFAPSEVYAADIDGIRMDNWMQYMPDNAQISQLNLPGTHDATTAFVPRLSQYWARCQRKTVTEQLDAGIRVLDLRCGLLTKDGENGCFMINPKGTKIVGPERMGMNHAGIQCYRTADIFDFRILTLETVMKDVDKFLAAHKSETVVLLVADEVQINVPGTGDYEKQQKQIIRNSFNEMKKQLAPGRKVNEGDKWARFDFYAKEDKVPQLGDTRGRCVMFDDMGTYTGYETHYRGEDVSLYSHMRDLRHVDETSQTQIYGTNTAKFWEQDYKNWEKEGEPDIKWVTSSMNNEGVGSNIFEKIGSVFVMTPLSMASVINPFIRELDMPVTHRFGWLMMDFPTGDNIRHIIESNMGYTSMQLVFDFRDLINNDPEVAKYYNTTDVIDRIYRYSDNYEQETIMLKDLEKNHQVYKSDSDGIKSYIISGLDMKDDKGADWHYLYGENSDGSFRIIKAQKEPAINDYNHPVDDHGRWTTRQVYYKADMGMKDHLMDYEFPIVWYGENDIDKDTYRPHDVAEFIEQYGGIVLEMTDPVGATVEKTITLGEPSSDDPDAPYITYPKDGNGKIVVHNLEKYNDLNFKYSYTLKGTCGKNEDKGARYTPSAGSNSKGKYLLMSLTDVPYATVDIPVTHEVNTSTTGVSSPGFHYTLSLVGDDGEESIIAVAYDSFPMYVTSKDFEFKKVRFDEAGEYKLRVRTTENNFVDAWSHDIEAKEITVKVEPKENGDLEGRVEGVKPVIKHEYCPLYLSATFVNTLEDGNPNQDKVDIECKIVSKNKYGKYDHDVIPTHRIHEDKEQVLKSGYPPITEPGAFECKARCGNLMNNWICEDGEEYFSFVVDFDNDGKLVVVGSKPYTDKGDNGVDRRVCDIGTFEFTHRNLKETTDINVKVEFEEYESVLPDDFDGSVDLKLEQVNGDKKTFNESVSKADSWEYTFEKMDKYTTTFDSKENGSNIEYELVDYKLTPEAIENYDAYVHRKSYNEFVVTYVANRPSFETVDVKAQVKWNDHGKITKRPAKVNTYFVTDGDYENRTVYPTYALSGWNTEYKGVAKYGFDPRGESAKDVHLMKYTVVADSVEGYEGPVITGTQDDGYTITYTLKEAKKDDPDDDDDDDDIVDTGDHNNLSLMFAIMGGAIAALAGLVLCKRKLIK